MPNGRLRCKDRATGLCNNQGQLARENMATKRDAAATPAAPARGPADVGVLAVTVAMGAMMSLSAFAVPVILDTNPVDGVHTLRQWVRVYHYGHIYLPALCVATTGLYAFEALRKRSQGKYQWVRYALAAVSTLVMVPFTWIFMTPTNNTLFALEAAAAASDPGALADTPGAVVRSLVVRWAWLHVTRSLTPLFGAYLGFTGLLCEMRSSA
ncbi:hypothetical protein THAR02_07932 [Trichoderma harzianum]|uniref:DUF1772 domain-containing protein n=1 Tax=Trichoderma harzianum TaxID=5544 RepID=A0A0F9X5T1_TRIHA|nr:hypothetical protein THAR02_07932 [Trichoderma harzianum]